MPNGSEQFVERQQRKHVDLQPLPGRHPRFLVKLHRLSIFQRAPNEMALTESIGLAPHQDVAVRRLCDIREAGSDLKETTKRP